MNGNDQPRDLGADFRQGVNLVAFLAQAHAACLTPFLRIGFGLEYPGAVGIGSLIGILVYGSLTGDVGMLWFVVTWLVAMVAQRSYAQRQWNSGLHEHSQYDGRPWMALRLRGVKTEQQARRVEPALCLLLGLLIAPWSPPTALFVAAGCVSLGLLQAVRETVNRRQVIAMNDLRLEQRFLSQRMRELDSNRRNF